ncbi:MAG: substrate-binding periplasmic protein [Bdellovibrionales bacterium]
MKLSEALIVGMAGALIAAALLRAANWAGTTELQLASQPAFDRVVQTRTLRCAYSSVAGYFANVDPTRNLTRGLVYDIVKEMGRILDLEIVWVEEIDPARVAENLAAGREDAMCFPIWPNGNQAMALDYTLPLDYVPIYAYARADDTRFDGDLGKINGKDIVTPVIEGGIVKKIVDESFPSATQYALPADSDAMRLLLAVTTKNADVAFADPFTGEDFIRNNPGTLKRVANADPVRVFPDSFAVAKGETKLRDMMNVAIGQMQRSGFIRATLDKYLSAHKGLYFNPSRDWEAP